MADMPAQHLQETAHWAQETFELSVPQHISFELLEELLADRLELLISRNFQQFVFLLYRLDIPENKVRHILDEVSVTEPYKKIAALIIERQLQKIKSREAFKNTQLPDDEERW